MPLNPDGYKQHYKRKQEEADMILQVCGSSVCVVASFKEFILNKKICLDLFFLIDFFNDVVLVWTTKSLL